MTFDVHFGTRNQDRLIALLEEHPKTIMAFSNGDSWHCWGEGPDKDIHVVARLNTLGQAIDLATFAVWSWTDDLVPMEEIEGHYPPGVLAVVSLSEDWSVQYLDAYLDEILTKSSIAYKKQS